MNKRRNKRNGGGGGGGEGRPERVDNATEHSERVEERRDGREK